MQSLNESAISDESIISENEFNFYDLAQNVHNNCVESDLFDIRVQYLKLVQFSEMGFISETSAISQSLF